MEAKSIGGKARRRLDRPRCRWADNIKMDVREVGWNGMDWVNLALVRMARNLWVP
jgi:hypothetical protein